MQDICTHAPVCIRAASRAADATECASRGPSLRQPISSNVQSSRPESALGSSLYLYAFPASCHPRALFPLTHPPHHDRPTLLASPPSIVASA